MQDFLHKKIVLGICGGIAAYKAAYLIRELTQLGAEVRVVMTASAEEFITPLTLQTLSGYPVRTALCDPSAEQAMGHIELARWADYLLIAPATANCLAKLAHGIADDLLSTLYLVFDRPTIFCPAMNKNMWLHPATQENCSILIQRGNLLIGPDDGDQACGEVGLGRLSDLALIVDALRLVDKQRLMIGKRVLITAGATQEALDPVRYITNHSSGRMGFALAYAAFIAGAEVTLVAGENNLICAPGIHYHKTTSAQAMYEQVMSLLEPDMIFIGCAAVADYAPLQVAKQKIKKVSDQPLELILKQNPDIIASVAHTKKASYVVGFAAETEQVIENAQKKLIKKDLDMVIANRVSSNEGFNAEENQVSIITKNNHFDLEKNNKMRLAGEIIAILAASLQNADQSNQ